MIGHHYVGAVSNAFEFAGGLDPPFSDHDAGLVEFHLGAEFSPSDLAEEEFLLMRAHGDEIGAARSVVVVFEAEGFAVVFFGLVHGLDLLRRCKC